MNEPVVDMLDQISARVLASLMEKQITTPDYYPLTLKALTTACNQKSSRRPVMKLSESEVAATVNALRHEGLVTARMDGRVDRYEQQLSRKLRLNIEQRAILCVLMLRGPLTLNEIRIHTSRMVTFSDNDALQTQLTQLADGEDPLMVCLGRQPGQREARYAHRLCGEPVTEDVPAQLSAPATTPSSERLDQLAAEVAQLRAEVRALQQQLQGLAS